MVHIRFVCELYKLQDECGRYFVHEHPQGGTSCYESCVKEVMERDGVSKTIIDQCQYGQQSPAGDPPKKSTMLMSNSAEILKSMTLRCTGRGGSCSRPQG